MRLSGCSGAVHPLRIVAFSLILGLAMTSLSSDTIYAYYRLEDESTVGPLQWERMSTSRTKTGKKFVIYDNFNQIYTGAEQTPILFPHSDDFIPLDVIDGNVHVSFDGRLGQTRENKRNGLFYTNAPLQQMLDEYDRLEKGLRRSSSNQGKTSLSQRRPGSEGTRKKLTKTGTTSKVTKKKSTDSSATNKERRAANEYRSRRNAQKKKRDRKERKYAPESRSTSSQTDSIHYLKEDEGKQIRVEGQTKQKSQEFPIGGMSSGKRLKGTQDGLKLSEGRKMGREFEGDKSPPWTFAVLVTLYNFAFSHKIESIFCVVVVFLCVTGIRSLAGKW